MLLFVDDDIFRHIEVSRRRPDALQTASLIVAQSELIAGIITELWLDHDLGSSLVGGGFFDAGTNEPVGALNVTVQPLVDWLCASTAVPRTLPIRVHSWNGPAAARIVAQLQEAGFTHVAKKPFSFLEDLP